MSMIECEECKKEISDKAKVCPGCGAKTDYAILNNEKFKKLIVGCGATFIIVVLIIGFRDTLFHSKPNSMSQETYDLGMDALKIADDYLDGNIESELAGDKLNSIKSKIDNLYEQDDNTYTFITGSSVLILSANISLGTDADVSNSRNELADTLNWKRK